MCIALGSSNKPNKQAKVFFSAIYCIHLWRAGWQCYDSGPFLLQCLVPLEILPSEACLANLQNTSGQLWSPGGRGSDEHFNILLGYRQICKAWSYLQDLEESNSHVGSPFSRDSSAQLSSWWWLDKKTSQVTSGLLWHSCFWLFLELCFHFTISEKMPGDQLENCCLCRIKEHAAAHLLCYHLRLTFQMETLFRKWVHALCEVRLDALPHPPKYNKGTCSHRSIWNFIFWTSHPVNILFLHLWPWQLCMHAMPSCKRSSQQKPQVTHPSKTSETCKDCVVDEASLSGIS